MNWNKDKTYRLLGILLVATFLWFFTEIVVYLIISSLIGVIGQPLVRLIQKIHIRKKPFPVSIAAAISLLSIIIFIGSIIYVITPVVGKQAEDLMKIDIHQLEQQWGNTLASTEEKFKEIGILGKDEELERNIGNQLSELAKTIQIKSIVNKILGMTGSIFTGIFAVLFMSYFFIKEDKLLGHIIMLFAPEKNKRKTQHILLKIRKLLSRYFIGLILEITSMIILITIGGLILGLKNALLIGFLGGLMNVIPYLGPLIGVSIASTLILMSNVYLGFDHTLPLVGGIMLVFMIANLIDNLLLQPLIYSNSVHAHPLEVFIVIIMGGTLGGALGMIVAIPAYTILRVAVKEFMGERIFIKNITKDI